MLQTKAEYFDYATEFFRDCLAISEKKNADYTGVSTDPFANFKSVEAINIKAEVGMLTRMMDKMSRIKSFVDQGKLEVEDEGVHDTLRDLANYSCLLSGLIKSRHVDTTYPL